MIRVTGETAHRIDRRIYGQFVEHLGRGVYEGLWVGEESDIPNKNGLRSDAIAALRHIRVPLVRWPGGCFADDYAWMNGVGPERRAMVNTNWGDVIDPSTFGTHEFFELLHQLDAEAYVNGNVGSGTVAEMRDWIEYMTLAAGTPMADLRARHGREQPFRVAYFGVGNESWGCGGNMTALHYANLYRQYQTYVRDYGDDHIAKVACGADSDDYQWTEVLMARAATMMDGLSVHYYTRPTGQWDTKGSATDFDERDWTATVEQARRMDEILTRHRRIMDRFDPAQRISLIVDEWGTWYDRDPQYPRGSLYQQSTVRDAVTAALTLNIFHRHGARVRMANIAQMVNVLQAMLLTDGPALVTTPTYHVFDLYTDHHDADAVQTQGAAGDRPGRIGLDGDYTVSRTGDDYAISVTNTSPRQSLAASFELPGAVRDVVRAQFVEAARITSLNTFADPGQVRLADLTGCRVSGSRLEFELPPHSVATVRVTVGS
ncbi:MAG TPA: alpha-L-arabinofuranosidase C-terminal domain-containing protein [Microbacterium sp.]|nr:alpha-L-arabinofuranosidase C-terminal domain-containing protein [Microbacterium sp.]